VTATSATASVPVERVIDILALHAFAAAAYGAIGVAGWLPLLGMLMLLVAFGLVLRTAGWLATHVPAGQPARSPDVVIRLRGAFHATRPATIALAWLFSLPGVGPGALGLQSSPATAILISAGGVIGAILPAASASLGTYELGAVTVAAVVGIPADDALQAALLSHVVAVVTILGMGISGLLLSSVLSPRSSAGERDSVDAAPDDFGTAEELTVTPVVSPR
jgi:hypothetical protein